MGLLQTVEDVLKADGSGDGNGDEDDELRAPEVEEATSLYRCAPCETTYITLEMETCPDCGASLEGTPNERDLGMT